MLFNILKKKKKLLNKLTFTNVTSNKEVNTQ